MRTILIRACDFVDDTKRRQRRRRGGAVIGALALSAIVLAGSPPPTVADPPSPQPVLAAPIASPVHVKAVVAPEQFPPLTVGNASPAQLFTISNPGNEPLEIRGVAASDPAFLMTNGCGRLLESRASCIIAAVFAPSKPGEQSASIAVETSNGIYAIPLHGAARPAPRVELASKPLPPSPSPCPQPAETHAPAEQKATMTFPTYMEGGSKAANDAVLKAAKTQLQNVWQVSLAGTVDPPELTKQLGELLNRNRIVVVEHADVAIHFDGTLDRGRLGRKHRAAEATITRNGRPVLRYVLPSEEYRVGDNPAEAFVGIMRHVFNQ